MPLKKTWISRVTVLILLIFSLVTAFTSLTIPVAAQDEIQATEEAAQPAEDPCAGTRYLIARDLTPYQMLGEGGRLSQATNQTVNFNAGTYAQFYAFNVIRQRNAAGSPINASVSVAFSNITPELTLEYALYRGMEVIQSYTPLTDEAFTTTLNRDGYYTLMIRRTRVQDSDIPGSLIVNATYPGNTDVVQENLPDSATRLLLAEPPRVENGVTVISVPSSNLRLNTGSAISASSQNGQGVQVRYDNGALLVGGWAQGVDLLGGDLAAYGETQQSNVPRIFFLQDWDYRREFTSDILNIEDPAGNRITTDWQSIKGLWLLRSCVGIELIDGRTFVAPTLPEARQVTFSGPIDEFSIRVNSISPLGNLLPYLLDIDWNGIQDDSELTLQNGVLTAQLDGNRLLTLESTQIRLDRVAPAEGSEIELQQSITLGDRGATISLDWLGIEQFRLTANEFSLVFTDARAALVQAVTRSALGLQSLRALNGVIQIRYQDLADGNPGEHRLLLSEAESYLEIITPAGFPSFNSLSQPGEVGYSPRGLNNLGAECYPVNTTLKEANCPPNGEPNPANGNLWYGINDLVAEGGYGLDLALTRSYNSRAAGVDSPFGFGWTTDYLVDYNVPFDPTIGTRPVTPELIQSYRIGLDLTYAPRGLVVFTTPTGSRHVFTTEPTPNFDGGTMTSLTMPGWTLTRANVLTGWTLRQTDGLTYEFDRGGRVLRYGYPRHNRIITVSYPGVSLTATSEVQFPNVAISDDFEQRQIELYYEGDHIARSVLRDMTQSEAFAECEAAANCYENTYRYQNGNLVEVTYSDGAIATYTYDEAHRMISHNDPRAPITPVMNYTYTENNLTEIAVVVNNEPTVWRTLSLPQQDTEQRIITVTDNLGRSRTYTYTLEDIADLRERSNAYTLASVTSPLPGVPGNDGLPQTFTWQDGLLTRINPRVSGDNIGRNSISFTYDPAGEINRVTGGFLEFSLTDSNGLSTLAQFADGTTQAYTYDERGLPVNVTDRQGTVYQLEWDINGHLQRQTRVSDARITNYTHNSLGLVTSVTIGNHVIRYGYDALGRIIRIEDAQLGAYDITYRRISSETEIAVTNPLGVISISRFDGQGRLVARSLVPSTGDPLRRMLYSYDAFDRLTAEQTDVSRDETGVVQYFTTTYIYSPVAEIQNPDGGTTVINGYSITRRDPLGRSEIYTYDAFDRIRQVQGINQQITRYDYAPVQAPNYPNGFLITSRDYRGTTLYVTTNYTFDLRGQLREVERTAGEDVQQWVFNTEGDPVRLRFLTATDADIRNLSWSNYQGVQPGSVDLNPVPLELPSEFGQPTARLNITFDTLGRVIRITDGSGIVTQRAYCPLNSGGYEVRISQPNQSEEFGCESSVFAESAIFDIHERLLQATDAYGTRIFSYQQDTETQEWVVGVDFQDGNQWEMRYNAAGDLETWRDTYGVERVYMHDKTGRLIRLEIADSPEASFTFEYNAIGQLTRQVDDLGRGFVYQYDDQGLLLVRQDILTGENSIYSYLPTGQMRSAVSPLGNSISFRYEDSADPTRLTEIVDQTGVSQRFSWDESANTITYTDVRGNATSYTFDPFGDLWLVNDAAGRNHELHYDGAGQLTQALTSVSANGAARSFNLTRPDANSLTVREADQTEWAWNFGFNGANKTSLTSVTDPNGNAMQLVYDPLRRLSGMVTGETQLDLTRPPGENQILINDVPYQFDNLNRLTQQGTDENAVSYTYAVPTRADTSLTVAFGDIIRTYTFSPGNDLTRPRTTQITAPGETITYTYSPEGLITEYRIDSCMAADVTSCVLPSEGPFWTRSVRFSYDGQGRPVRIIDEEQNVETFSYDDAGNLIAYQSTSGRTYNYAYDALNRLTFVTSPTGVRILVNYDGLDNVIGICRTRAELANNFQSCVDANGEQETYNYDSLGRLVEQNFPNLGSPAGTSTIVQRYLGNQLNSWGVRNQPDLTVNRTYSADIFSLLTELTLNTGSIDFAYDEAGRLQAAGDDQYSYDGYGRLSGFNSLNPYTVNYLAENHGYTITNDNTGESVLYGLDDRGFLAALDYGIQSQDNDSSLAIPLTSITYGVSASQPNTLGVVICTKDTATDTQPCLDSDLQKTLDLQVNRLRETQYLTALYADLNGETSQLLVDYLTNTSSQRQRINGSSSTQFTEGANDYTITTGYNDDNQPTSVNVSSENSGLLYQLIFTYNDTGQRLTESRSYADNTQVNITYEYGTPNQLVRRILQVIPPTITGTASGMIPTAAAATIGLPFMMAWRRSRKLKRWTRRLMYSARSRMVIIGAGVFFSFMLFSAVEAQQLTRTFTFEYDYDAAGNMASITSVNNGETTLCRSYTYDSANRLIGVSYASQGIERTYRYDAYNRMIGTDDTALIYAGEQPFQVEQGEITGYFGRLQNRAPVWAAFSPEDIRWQMLDGRDDLLTTEVSSEDGELRLPVALYDPFSRSIPLAFQIDLAAEDFDSCVFNNENQDMRSLLNPYGWNNTTSDVNLYFSPNGRAYDPVIGRYLQRDFYGPSMFGNVYEQRQQPAPAYKSTTSSMAVGFETYAEALAIIVSADMLTAQNIAQTYYPQVNTTSDWTTALSGPSAVTQTLTELLTLPAYLQQGYNLTGVEIDAASGALLLDTQAAPGQNGGQLDIPDLFDVGVDLWSPTPIALPEQTLQQLISMRQIPFLPLTSYRSRAWLPDSYVKLAGIWTDKAPQLSAFKTPDVILEWLPQPLEDPEHSFPTLDFAEALTQLPFLNAGDWWQRLLQQALPQMIDLPPRTVEDYRSQWFTDDIFGLQQRLGKRIETPRPPYLPVYSLGYNSEWVFPQPLP
jgi:YD repeat-containing protein